MEYRQLKRDYEDAKSALEEERSRTKDFSEQLRETLRKCDAYAAEKNTVRLQAIREKWRSEEVIKNLNEKLDIQSQDLSTIEKVFETIKIVRAKFICHKEGEKEDVLTMIEQISRHLEAKEEELQDAFARTDNVKNQVIREKKQAKMAMSKKDSSIDVLSRENRQLREEKENLYQTCQDLKDKFGKLQEEMECQKEVHGKLRSILQVLNGPTVGGQRRQGDEDDGDWRQREQDTSKTVEI